MRKLQTRTRVSTYLSQRATISTRFIDWPKLSLEFAAKVIRKFGKPSKFTLCKLLYGKYDDSQYKDVKELCPMCMTGHDDREHLLRCHLTQHLWDIADTEKPFLPTEPNLYAQMNISSDVLSTIRHTIATTIRYDMNTRIGIFNRNQQDKILQSLHGVRVNEQIGRAVRAEIEHQLAPWIRATLAAVSLRNKAKHKKRLLQEDHEKQRSSINYNIFDHLLIESDDDVDAKTICMHIVSTANQPTSLVFSQEQFDIIQTDDFFLTDARRTPTVIITHFLEQNATAQKWVRFIVH
jgi:hypothetical protein